MGLLKYEQQLETTCCASCGMEFAVPVFWIKAKRDQNGSLWCPNGHSLQFNGETSDQKIARANSQREAAETAKRFAEGLLAAERLNHKKELERRDKRAHAGVCMQCNRTFVNVSRHMASKHK